MLGVVVSLESVVESPGNDVEAPDGPSPEAEAVTEGIALVVLPLTAALSVEPASSPSVQPTAQTELNANPSRIAQRAAVEPTWGQRAVA